MARKHIRAAVEQPQPHGEAISTPSGRAFLQRIFAEYTQHRSKQDFDPEEWADNPAHFAEEALRCLDEGDTDQGLGWAMHAAALASGLDWIRPYQGIVLGDFKRRTAHAKKHRADPQILAEGYEKMAQYRNDNPECSKNAAANWAANELKRKGARMTARTLLNHVRRDPLQRALWND